MPDDPFEENLAGLEDALASFERDEERDAARAMVRELRRAHEDAEAILAQDDFWSIWRAVLALDDDRARAVVLHLVIALERMRLGPAGFDDWMRRSAK
jgi:hypothetical protein